jgi:hypothetical protein
MNLQRLILLAGAVALIIGVIGLLVGVSVPGPANLPVLNEIIPHSDYVAQCQSAVSGRRAWTIPVAVVGLMVIAGSFFVGGRAGSVRTP